MSQQQLKDAINSISARTLNICLAAWFISMLISISIYIGGISDQLTFSSGKVCLLYVENYHWDKGLNAWLFDSFSPSCGASVAAGSIGLILIFGLIGTRFYFIRKNEEPSRNVILTLAVVTTVWAGIAFIMACVFSTGFNQTCSQFQNSGKSCGAVFGEGFFANDTSTIYRKNINTINAALGASWIVFIGFAGYAGYEWYSFKNSSLKWW